MHVKTTCFSSPKFFDTHCMLNDGIFEFITSYESTNLDKSDPTDTLV